MASLFNTIILLASVQGFIVSSLLFFSKKNRATNRILAALILLISLACFNLYGNYANWFNSNVLLLLVQLIPLVIVMPFGPLVYFYTRSSLDPSFKIGKKEKRHFYTVVIDLVPSLTVIVFMIGVFTGLLKNHQGPWGIFIDTFNVYADIPRWMSVTYYVWLSAKFLKEFHQKNNGQLNGHAVHFTWLQQFIKVFMVFQSVWFVYLVPYVIPAYTNWMLNTFDWFPIYIPMAFLIYWLGIKGYMVSQQQTIDGKKLNSTANVLSPALVQQVIAALLNAMENDNLFMNPNCSVATVAEAISFPPKTISAVLNQHLQKSFNEFVNGYRVAAFKEKLLQPAMNHLTIAGIAQECGFNSQATFQRTFKELAGKSPSEFRKLAFEPLKQGGAQGLL